MCIRMCAGHSEAVSFLVEHGANVNSEDRCWGNMPRYFCDAEQLGFGDGNGFFPIPLLVDNPSVATKKVVGHLNY